MSLTSTNQRYYWGIRIAMPTVQLFTNAPFTVSYGGESYVSNYKMAVSSIGQNDQGIQESSVTISNGDGSLGTLFQALSGSYRNPDVIIYEWKYDEADFSSTTIQETVILANGRAEFPKWTSETVSFRVRNAVNSVASKSPWKGYGKLCPYAHDFKGEQCAATTTSYTTCLGTFADCTARSNTARFGGMRHSPKDGHVIHYGQDGTFILGPPPETPAN